MNTSILTTSVNNNTISSIIELLGVDMRGKVLPRGCCPECQSEWEFYREESKKRTAEGYRCPVHKFVKPERFRIDVRQLGIGFIYSDPFKRKDKKEEGVLDTYGKALRLLIDINAADEKARIKNTALKPDDWLPAKVKEKWFENITSKWIRNYEEEVRARAKSQSRLNNINKALSYLNPYFKGCNIEEISRDDIEKFYHSLLDKDLSKKYIKDILDTLKSVLKRYVGKVPEFPVFTVIPAKEKQRLGLDREILILDKVPAKYSLQILLLVRTGMRINEVCALKVKDVINGLIYVDKAISDGELRLSRKSGKVVSYRVTPELWEQLSSHIYEKDLDSYIFECQNPRRLYKAWEKACSDAKVKRISLQQASRHSTATEIWRKYEQAALQEISGQLGNNKQTVKNHYLVSE